MKLDLKAVQWLGIKAFVFLLVGSLVAAVCMYAWGMIYWRELLPNTTIKQVQNADDFIRFLQSDFPLSGTYMLPSPKDDPEAIRELRETGPVATLHVLNRRNIPSQIRRYRLAHSFVTAFLIAWVVRKIRPQVTRRRSRVIIVGVIGLAAALYSDLGDPVWWFHPLPWSIAKAVFDLSSWVIAGLAADIVVNSERAALG